MTQITRRRRKKRRFYWVELGFLLLGIIGLRPEILTELFPSNRSNIQSLSQSPAYTTMVVPFQQVQPVVQHNLPAYQPLYQVAQQPATHSYSLYANQPQSLPQSPLPYNAGYDPTRYDSARIASNPAQVTSRYNNATGYSTGSVSSNSSYPPVVWPEGYQPGANQPGLYQTNSYPPAGSTYYRR